jgi:hypothetical protein
MRASTADIPDFTVLFFDLRIRYNKRPCPQFVLASGRRLQGVSILKNLFLSTG